MGAYWHHPRWSAGATHGSLTKSAPFWDVLYEYGAEFVYSGNDHTYQRFAPQTPSGQVDQARGLRQFVVGTGGTQHYPLNAPLANTQVQTTGTFGALKLTLHANSYELALPAPGRAHVHRHRDHRLLAAHDRHAEPRDDHRLRAHRPRGLHAGERLVLLQRGRLDVRVQARHRRVAEPAPRRARSPGSRRDRTPSACAPPTPPATSTPTEATRTWTVDTVAPDTTIGSGPSWTHRLHRREHLVRLHRDRLDLRVQARRRRLGELHLAARARGARPGLAHALGARDRPRRQRRPDARPRARGRWTPRPRTPRSPVAPPARWPPPRPASPSPPPRPARRSSASSTTGAWQSLHLAAGAHGARAGRPHLPRARHRHRRKRRRHARPRAPGPSTPSRPTPRSAPGPPARSPPRSATLGFSSDDAQASFQCKLDDGAWESCTSPRALTGLAQGAHTLPRARHRRHGQHRRDRGHAQPGPSTPWRPTPPSPRGRAGRPRPTPRPSRSRRPRPARRFECKLDDGAWQTCTSPRALTGLAQGAHTFRVRATDPAGNVDADRGHAQLDRRHRGARHARSPPGRRAPPPPPRRRSPSRRTTRRPRSSASSTTAPGRPAPRRGRSPGLAQGRPHLPRTRHRPGRQRRRRREAARTWSVDTVAPSTIDRVRALGAHDHELGHARVHLLGDGIELRVPARLRRSGSPAARRTR